MEDENLQEEHRLVPIDGRCLVMKVYCCKVPAWSDYAEVFLAAPVKLVFSSTYSASGSFYHLCHLCSI